MFTSVQYTAQILTEHSSSSCNLQNCNLFKSFDSVISPLTHQANYDLHQEETLPFSWAPGPRSGQHHRSAVMGCGDSSPAYIPGAGICLRREWGRGPLRWCLSRPCLPRQAQVCAGHETAQTHVAPPDSRRPRVSFYS